MLVYCRKQICNSYKQIPLEKFFFTQIFHKTAKENFPFNTRVKYFSKEVYVSVTEIELTIRIAKLFLQAINGQIKKQKQTNHTYHL